MTDNRSFSTSFFPAIQVHHSPEGHPTPLRGLRRSLEQHPILHKVMFVFRFVRCRSHHVPFIEGANAPGNGGFPLPPFMFPFGMDMMEQPDDPKRAQRLVDGLEEVPAGLVKRMERAGGPGSSPGEVPNCSVCWESLLDPEGGGFEGNAQLAKDEADAEAAREDEAARNRQESTRERDASSSTPSGSAESATTASSSTAPSDDVGDSHRHPKVVVLPCAHAFHATCLLPWFSKPGRTTCPSCRFDIDPDSLTYRARPLRPRAPSSQAAPGPTPQAGMMPPPDFFRLFGQPPPSFPTSAGTPQAQPAPAPVVVNVPDIASDAPANAGPQNSPDNGHGGQRRQQPLPPFITFDASMIIPIFPGRGAGAAAPGAGAQGSQPGGDNAQGPPPPPPPRTDHSGFRMDDTLLQDTVRSTFERLAWSFMASQPPPNMPGPQRRSSGQRPAEKRHWTPPPAPGPTLRQVVERNEREMGLRCSDVSCGIGPSDEDDLSAFPALDFSTLRQIGIRPPKDDTSGREAVCEHKFHPACLVSAGRVAGWGHEEKTGEPAGEDEDVEVSCPVCRSVGVISRLEWEEGACELA